MNNNEIKKQLMKNDAEASCKIILLLRRKVCEIATIHYFIILTRKVTNSDVKIGKSKEKLCQNLAEIILSVLTATNTKDLPITPFFMRYF